MIPPEHARPHSTTFDLVDLAEIARRLDVQANTVHQWRKRRLMPRPDYDLEHPVWRWSTIRQWAIETGRL